MYYQGTEMMEVPASTRDLTDQVMGDDGRLRILPAEFWAQTTVHERTKVSTLNGLYLLPTVELVDYLKERIGGRKAIEIGSGNGVLAETLGITATDSFQQEDPRFADVYGTNRGAIGQPPVRYGPNVKKMTASRAVRIMKPDVVLACWVTHKHDRQHIARGNAYGVDEAEVIRGCKEYIFVGNQHIHKGKPTWPQVNRIEYPPFVYSRAFNGSPDFIATWLGGRG